MYYIELLVQFPLAAYIVWNMASKKPTTGPTELAGLAFGCLTAMGSVACVAELLSMGGDMVSESQKMSLAWGTYAPYAVLREFCSPSVRCFANSCSWYHGGGYVYEIAATCERRCQAQDTVNTRDRYRDICNTLPGECISRRLFTLQALKNKNPYPPTP